MDDTTLSLGPMCTESRIYTSRASGEKKRAYSNAVGNGLLHEQHRQLKDPIQSSKTLANMQPKTDFEIIQIIMNLKGCCAKGREVGCILNHFKNENSEEFDYNKAAKFIGGIQVI
jgi:hypothetical protein